MKGAVVYFSGTGNTEFAAKLFKDEFLKHGIDCNLIDTSKRKIINDNYDFYVFGCTVHADLFPDFYIDWIKRNIIIGNNRKCIIFSTQAGKSSSGSEYLYRILKQKDFNVLAKTMIMMPQNFYIAGFRKTPSQECEELKENAKLYIKQIVENFIKNEKTLIDVSKFRVFSAGIIYCLFKKYTLGWAKRNLDIDMNKCVKCSKCVKNCPSKNIKMEDKIYFKSLCICCQRCLNSCPVNAFMYKGKQISQYKL